MPPKTAKGFKPSIGDDAVRAKTGKRWPEWFAILDKAGASAWNHTKIASHLDESLGVSPWWSQMVANTYEQARGLRVKHEMADGFQIGASKTLDVPIARAWAVWHDEPKRKRWLNEEITVTKATPNKSIRARWPDDTRLDIMFYAKGDSKCQVVVNHTKIPNEKEAARMKTHWKEALEKMQAVL